MARSTEFRIGPRKVVVLDRSIAALRRRCQALVSPDDNYLSHGGGASAALWGKAGPALAAEVAASMPRLRLGDVHVTPAFLLDATYLLHAVTLDLDANRGLGPREAQDLAGAVLDRAVSLGADTVGFPLLGGGAGLLGEEAAATAIVEAIQARSDESSSLVEVTISALGPSFDNVVAVLEARVTSEPSESVDSIVSRAAAAVGGETGRTLLEAWIEASRRPLGPQTAYARVALLHASVDALLEVSLRILSERAASDPRVRERSPARHIVFDEKGRCILKDRRPGLGERLEATVEAFEYADRTVPGDLVSTVRDGISERNRLAHGPLLDGPEVAHVRSILLAVERICREILSLVPAPEPAPVPVPGNAEGSTGAAAGRLSTALVGGLVGAGVVGAAVAIPRVINWVRRAGEPRPEASATASASVSVGAEPLPTAPPAAVPCAPHPSGTDHVRKLRVFLREAMDPAEMKELLEHLGSEGYRGDDDIRLLEFCVNMDDPAGFVASRFKAFDLRRELRGRAGVSRGPETEAGDLAAELLAFFGFPVAREAAGLLSALKAVRNLRVHVQTGSLQDLRGAVTTGACWLEYIAKVLLRFVAMAAFREPPDILLRRLGVLRPHETVERSSLGSLLDGLEQVSKEFETCSDPKVEVFGRSLKSRRLVPPGNGTIANLRNRFSHFKEAYESQNLADSRREARTFLDEAKRLLEYLADEDHRVFPRVVVIQSIHTDRWGRRIVKAREEGQEEHLFTDTEVAPGQVYFMYALSNPLRVDPILVPAGDTGAPGRG